MGLTKPGPMDHELSDNGALISYTHQWSSPDWEGSLFGPLCSGLDLSLNPGRSSGVALTPDLDLGPILSIG